jgi:dihydrofolate reductase
MTELVLIAAVARNGAIGRDNDLIFGDPADQKHFRQATMGSPVVMGRKTWDSLPARFRPLPGRRNIVVSRSEDWQGDGAECASSLDAALALAAQAPKVFVIGGGELYALALPHADTLLLTEVGADLPGDTFFPAWDREAFSREELATHYTASGLPFHIVRYRRKP